MGLPALAQWLLLAAFLASLISQVICTGWLASLLVLGTAAELG